MSKPLMVTASRMGRPPLSQKSVTQPTMVRLTEDARNRIAALVGKDRMAAFIREAIENELDRREKSHPPSRQPKDGLS